MSILCPNPPKTQSGCDAVLETARGKIGYTLTRFFIEVIFSFAPVSIPQSCVHKWHRLTEDFVRHKIINRNKYLATCI